MKPGIELIAEERKRQIEVEGWDYSHDADYGNGELIGAAACYAINALNKDRSELFARAQVFVTTEKVNDHGIQYSKLRPKTITSSEWKDAWPWDAEWDKREKHDKVRSLVIAGALIAAELDRLQNSEP